MDWKNIVLKLAIVVVAVGVIVASGYVDPSMREALRLIAGTLIGWIIPAPQLSRSSDDGGALTR